MGAGESVEVDGGTVAGSALLQRRGVRGPVVSVTGLHTVTEEDVEGTPLNALQRTSSNFFSRLATVYAKGRIDVPASEELQLPYQVVRRLLTFLDLRDLARMCLVCKEWKKAAAVAGRQVLAVDVTWYEGKRINPRIIDFIGTHFSHLKTLSLAGCELSNLDLDKLSRSLGELQRLDLTRCYGFSDEGLDKLYRFKHLVALHLEALSEEEWEEKTQSVSLSQESSASSSQGSQSSTSSKGKKPPSHAVMFRTKIDTLQQLVDFCPELQLLDLARRPIGNTAFERLGRFPALRFLDLSFSKITDKVLQKPSDSQFPALELIRLCHVPDISVEGLCTFVGNTPSLKAVDVQHCSQFQGVNVHEALVQHLKTLPRIPSFHTRDVKVIQ